MSARDRLAQALYQAGYDQHTLLAIATATLPRYQAGEALDDAHLSMVIDAIEVLAQAGASNEQVQAIIARFQAAGGDWRDGFWTQTLQVACSRYNQPDNLEFKIQKIELLAELKDKAYKGIRLKVGVSNLNEELNEKIIQLISDYSKDGKSFVEMVIEDPLDQAFGADLFRLGLIGDNEAVAEHVGAD